MSEPIWPNEVRGEGEGVPWLNKLLRGIKKTWLKDVVFVGGSAKLIPSTDGQTLVLSANIANDNLLEMFPFKIYNSPNRLDASKTPLTFQIRGGLIGYRSRHFLPNDGTFIPDPPVYGDTENILSTVGTDSFASNYSPNSFLGDQMFSDPQPSIPSVNNQGEIQLLNSTDVIIGENSLDNLVQVVLASELDATNSRCASFWLEAIDDVGYGYLLRLWGRMFSITPGDPNGRPVEKFPAPAQNIFQIGCVEVKSTNVIFVIQYLRDHLIGRYPVGGGDIESPLYFRGFWNSDALSNQVFYTGDIVVDDTQLSSHNTTSGTFSFNKQYAYVGGIGSESSAPHFNPLRWQYIGVYL